MAGKQPLMWDETVFQRPELFELDYLPEELPHRENQMASLAANLRPALRGAAPTNAYCRGPPGTGKTSAVLKVFEALRGQTSSVVCVHVNCQLSSTRFAVFSKVYRALTGQEAPSSGVPFQKLYDRTARSLTKQEKVLVVALDDVNYLLADREASEVVYSLLRMHENYPGTKVGVIAIISDLTLDLVARLDARAQSVFLAEEIPFPAYGRDEIRDILARRVELGFYPGAFPPELLGRVVDLTAAARDLRVGINLLKRAGLAAERRASRTVVPQDVDSAFTAARVLHLQHAVKSLSGDERQLLRALAEAARAAPGGEVMAGALYEVFSARVDRGYTSYYEMVNRLEDLGLLVAQRSGEGQRGQSRLISLAYPADDVLSSLDAQKA